MSHAEFEGTARERVVGLIEKVSSLEADLIELNKFYYAIVLDRTHTDDDRIVDDMDVMRDNLRSDINAYTLREREQFSLRQSYIDLMVTVGGAQHRVSKQLLKLSKSDDRLPEDFRDILV